MVGQPGLEQIRDGILLLTPPDMQGTPSFPTA